MFNSVLVAIGGSKYTQHILIAAKPLCHLYTQVHIIYVGKASSSSELTRSKEQNTVTERQAINEIIQEALDYLKTHEIKAKIHIVSGDPSEEVTKYASKIAANLIIMGHRKLTKFSRLFDPSTCLKVIENASCPVLIENLNKLE